MKVKIFQSDNIGGLEGFINEWLSTGNIWVYKTNQSTENVGGKFLLTMSFLYKIKE